MDQMPRIGRPPKHSPADAEEEKRRSDEQDSLKAYNLLQSGKEWSIKGSRASNVRRVFQELYDTGDKESAATIQFLPSEATVIAMRGTPSVLRKLKRHPNGTKDMPIILPPTIEQVGRVMAILFIECPTHGLRFICELLAQWVGPGGKDMLVSTLQEAISNVNSNPRTSRAFQAEQSQGAQDASLEAQDSGAAADSSILENGGGRWAQEASHISQGGNSGVWNSTCSHASNFFNMDVLTGVEGYRRNDEGLRAENRRQDLPSTQCSPARTGQGEGLRPATTEECPASATGFSHAADNVPTQPIEMEHSPGAVERATPGVNDNESYVAGIHYAGLDADSSRRDKVRGFLCLGSLSDQNAQPSSAIPHQTSTLHLFGDNDTSRDPDTLLGHDMDAVLQSWDMDAILETQPSDLPL